ncbi:MAG: hypothetical protein ACXVH3_12570 [Solirubrobacteraceae bacterium]
MYKARIVPDTAPDSMTERVIKVADLGVPIEVAIGRFEACDRQTLFALSKTLADAAMEQLHAGV